MTVSSVYRSTVLHVRQTPVRNAFSAKVCWYLLDLDELPQLECDLAPLFAVDAGRSATTGSSAHRAATCASTQRAATAP